MLLNLSNHPSTTWSAAQLSAAQAAYGGVSDHPFPAIDPVWVKQDIHALAEQYVATILALSPRPVAVHLMGELTFSFALVRLLQALGITCVASTARRQVVEKAPGHKEAIFEFVQFRVY
jgi:hypothetical protein